MKIFQIVPLVFISCLVLILGCAGQSKVRKQNKLMLMSNRELINHYKMIQIRMIDIDRSTEQMVEYEHQVYGGYYPNRDYNRLNHLHIGDNWYELKKEKKLILIEMKNRGILPP